MRQQQQAKVQQLVDEQERSGKSVPEFCAERGLREKTFYGWRQRVRPSANRFARIATDARVELEIGNGVHLRVAREDLRAVLEALR